MTVSDMIKYLRLNVKVQDPNNVVENDPDFLSMTDEDLELFLNIVKSRDFSSVPSLDRLPEKNVYPLILLAKKELFFTLAVSEAPLYDLGADNNNYLKRDQRFDHYMELIKQVDKEYQDYLDDGGSGGNILTSFDTLISNRYATKRNYEKGVTPDPLLYVEGVTLNSIEISWNVMLSRFKEYKVYLSTEPILDMFNVSEHIKSTAKLLVTINNVHQNKCRITNLESGTIYYVVVTAAELSGLIGYVQEEIMTLSDIIVDGGEDTENNEDTEGGEG